MQFVCVFIQFVLDCCCTSTELLPSLQMNGSKMFNVFMSLPDETKLCHMCLIVVAIILFIIGVSLWIAMGVMASRSKSSLPTVTILALPSSHPHKQSITINLEAHVGFI